MFHQLFQTLNDMSFICICYSSISLWVAILITACDVFLFMLLENTGIRIFEAMFAILIALMGASFLYMVNFDRIKYSLFHLLMLSYYF